MKVSVIIPTHNRSDALRETLSNLARQDFAGEWEAVVVNNNSTDDTDAVVENFEFPVPLKVVHEKIPCPAASRNAGVSAARGEYIIFIDNDILVEENFISQHVENLDENAGCWFVGRVKNPKQLRETAFGRFSDDNHENNFKAYPSGVITEIYEATGANWAMRRAEFLAVGGFDQSFAIASCEDAEFSQRAKQAGIRTMFNPHSVVLHNDWAINLDSYCRRQELYSISSVLLWRKYGEASFQKEIVKENAPVDLKTDSAKTVAKKLAKSALASTPGKACVRAVCKIIERVAPDTEISRKAYRAAVAVAIFGGVREGFKRYAENGGDGDELRKIFKG